MTRPSRRVPTPLIAIVAGVLMLLGAGVVLASVQGAVVPDRGELRRGSGTVESVKLRKYSVDFKLRGEPCSYSYASKGRQVKAVAAKLDEAGRANVEVMYLDPSRIDPPPASPSCPVFDIRIGDAPLRTYAQVKAAWERDNIAGTWFGGILGAAGALLALVVLRRDRRDAAA